MKANYINKTSTGLTVNSGKKRAYVSAFITFMMSIMMIVTVAAGAFTSTARADDDKKAFDAVRFVMCYFGDTSMAAKAYQFATTDDVPFKLRSKSSVGAVQGNVEGGLNSLLAISGHDFKTINETILGRPLTGYDSASGDDADAAGDTKTDDKATTTDGKDKGAKKELKFNSGPQVSFYDRFGVSGLNFTAYLGEWKYVRVKACDPDAKPKDPKAGLYYDERLVPRTTWDNIANTKDIRTAQLKRGVLAHEIMGTLTVLSNMIFNITKAIVAVTIALIGFAFSDIVHLLGIDKIIVGGGGKGQGMFGQIFKGLFEPLIALVFILTAINIGYMALFKKKIRESLVVMGRSLLLFLIAIIFSVKPDLVIKVPNTIAIIGQSIVVSSLGTSLSGGNGLCMTGVGDTPKTVKIGGGDAGDTTEERQDFIAKASLDINSNIGCSLWQQLLLKPWADGQFGRDWNGLWAKDKAPKWASKDAHTYAILEVPKSDSSEKSNKLVGDAAIPIGGGKFINNWGLFQISTQTNAHSPLNHDGDAPKVTANIANDWWRIVDVTSGYGETENKYIDDDLKGDGKGEVTTVSIADPTAKPVPDVWNVWVGASGGRRILNAIVSIPIAGVAVIGPAFFAGLAAVYSIGTAILLIFAPVMLLLGCWGNRGWEICKAWLNMLMQNIAKRIICGLLLVLSIMFTTTALNIIEQGSWATGVILMVVLSYALIKNKNKVFNAASSLSIGGGGGGMFTQSTNKINNRLKRDGKSAGKLTLNMAAGGVSAKAYGGSFKSGALAGSKGELRSIAYRNPTLRKAMDEYKVQKTNKNGLSAKDLSRFCFDCGDEFIKDEPVYMTRDGNYICEPCAERGDYNDAQEMNVDWDATNKKVTKEREEQIAGDKQKKTKIINRAKADDVAEAKLHNVKNGKITGDEAYKVIGDVASDVDNAIKEHKEKIREDIEKHPDRADRTQFSMEAPEELRDYLNPVTIKKAWEDGAYDYIKEAYTLAWIHWAVDKFALQYGDTLDEVSAAIRSNQEQFIVDNEIAEVDDNDGRDTDESGDSRSSQDRVKESSRTEEVKLDNDAKRNRNK